MLRCALAMVLGSPLAACGSPGVPTGWVLAASSDASPGATLATARAVSPAALERASSARRAADFSVAHAEWDRLASLDGAACRSALATAGVQFKPLPDRAEPDARGCGIPHGVLVARGPTGISYAPPLVIDCSFAAQLPAIEAKIQATAQEHLATSIRRVTTLGSFNCRPVRGGFREHLSEHAVGNAVDLGGFSPKRGRLITVAKDYRPNDEVPSTAESTFLHALYRALRSSGGLTHVIGPETRADHHDHLHLDRGEPWWRFFSGSDG